MLHQHRRGTSGFTLIELLVVIAIIAILASILFPVFTQAKRAGYRAVCVSNLRQFATAFQMYANDWERFPVPGGPGACERTAWINSVSTGDSDQVGGLWPYIRQRIRRGAKNNLWSCPLAAPIDEAHINTYYSPGLNYCMNDYVRSGHPGEGDWYDKPPSYYAGMDPAACKRPADCILLFESVQDRYGFVYRLGSPYFVPDGVSHPVFRRKGIRYAYVPQNYHAGKSDFLFVDGHVACMAPDQTWTQACRDGVLDGISNFTGYKVNGKIRATYPGYGPVDHWNPGLPQVKYP